MMNLKELTFGKLEVIDLVEKRGWGIGNSYWKCKCKCGNESTVNGANLIYGHTKSCGCLRNECVTRFVKTHGLRSSYLYGIWYSMIRRCTNIDDDKYYNYGGRGIRVCDQWIDSLENFIKDMGDRPSSKHTLDRIENDGNYEPSNCRWATKADQNKNKRTNRWLEYKGKKMIFADWQKKLNISHSTLWNQIAKRPFNEIAEERIKKYGIAISLLFLICFSSFSQVYNFTDAKNGEPNPIPNIGSEKMTRVNGAKKPNFLCSFGYSATSFKKTDVFSYDLEAIEFFVSPAQSYTANCESFSAELRRSGTGTMSARFAYSFDGIKWIDEGINHSPFNGLCGQTNKYTWDFADFSTTKKVIFRIYGFNASSGNGTLQLLNVVIGGSVKQSFIDNDGDGFPTETDCNDNDATIYPNAIEICNSIDDNCDTNIDEGLPQFTYYFDSNGDGYGDGRDTTTCSQVVPVGFVTVLEPPVDLAITDSKMVIPPYMWSANAADLGYQGSAEKCAADPVKDAVDCRLLTEGNIYDLVKGQNWYAIAFPEGQTTRQYQVIVGDSNVTRFAIKDQTDNGGYNCVSKLAIGGLCVCPCKIDNNVYDFFNSTVAMKNKLDAHGIIFVNVEVGLAKHQWEQIKWIVQQYNPEILVYGQEENGTASLFKGKVQPYIVAVSPLLDSVHKYYPYIINIADAAQVVGVGSNSSNNMTWNKSLKQSGLFDLGDFYTQLDNEFPHLTGVVAEDTATLKKIWQIHYALFDTLYSRLGMPIFDTQFTTAEAFNPTGAIVYPEQWIVAGSYSLPGYDLMFDYNVTHNNIIQGKILQTIKNTTGKGKYDITGFCTTLMANLFQGEATYLQMPDYGNIKMFGSKIGNEYRIVFYNNSGKEAVMPTTLKVDGKIITNMTWTGGTWYYADSFTSKDLKSYDMTGNVKGLSVGYAKISVPAN